MALSPADFYAYSRATGAPYPEDPEERAGMAPEVLEFRRNQLKAPQEESNPLAAIGAAALGLGGLVGLGFGAKRFLGRGQQIPKGPSKSATAGVRQVNLSEMQAPVRRAAAAPVRSSTPEPAPSKAPPTRQDVYEAIAQKPEEELPRVYRPKGGIYDQISRAADPDALQAQTLITDPNTGEIFSRGRSPQSFAQTYVSLRPALTGQRTDLPTARTPGTFKEFSQGIENAPSDIVDSILQKYESDYRRAEPFQYGSELSRQAAIARKNEQLIDDVLAEVRGNQPNLTDLQQSQRLANTDQFLNAVESGEDQMTGRRNEAIQRDIHPDAETNLVPQEENTRALSSEELKDLALSEMIQLRETLTERGLRPGTTRFDRALAASWTSKAGVTPGSEAFRESIALPKVIRNAVEAVTPDVETMGGLTIPERTLINIGPDAQITQTAAGTAIRGASPSYHEALPKSATRQLFGNPDVLVRGAPDELGLDLPGGMRITGGLVPDAPPERLSKQEIVYSILDRPSTEGPAGGSAGIGVYGVEPGYVPGGVSKATGQYSAAASRKPTDVPSFILKQERTPFTGVTSEGLRLAQERSTKSGANAIEKELQRRQVNQESVALSEVLRRGRIEGRDPQMILKQFGIGI
jgi:hypothetical protein